MWKEANRDDQPLAEVAEGDVAGWGSGRAIEATPANIDALLGGEPTEVVEQAQPASTPIPTEDTSEPPFPLAEPGEYYVGLWSGLPNYGCPYCSYRTLSGPGSIEIHILEQIDRGHPKHQKALEHKEF